MPLDRVLYAGNEVVAMGSVSQQRSFTLSTPADSASPLTFTRLEMNVTGLPSLTYWVRLQSAVANVIFTPQFSIMNTTTAGVTNADWRPFTNGFVLVPGNISLFTVRSAVAKMSIAITVPIGQSVTVDLIVSAGA